MSYLIVGLGGFLGAISRFAVYQLQKSLFSFYWPWATLTVNVLGCFMVGLLMGYNSKSLMNLDSSLTLFFAIGFLGSFTTFSAFGLESYKLYLANNWTHLFINIGLNVVLSLLAVAVGAALGSLKA
jgi:fluoride exporter